MRLSYKYWQNSEIKLLKERFPYLHKRKVIEFFPDRSFSSVQTKAIRLGIKKQIRSEAVVINTGLNPNFGYILGSVLGDGNIAVWSENNGSKHYLTRLFVKDRDFRDEFVFHVQKLGAHSTKWFDRKRKFYCAVVSSKMLYNHILNFNINKLLTADSKVQATFVRGFFDSEGSVTLSKKSNSCLIRAKNKSIVLLQICQNILNLFGIPSTITVVRGSGFNPHGIYFALSVCSQESVSSFYRQVGFTIERKQQKLKKFIKLLEADKSSHQVR